ncbi:MAG: competence/damage-inducible protein A [Candidatus Thorarchaeota archaeon]
MDERELTAGILTIGNEVIDGHVLDTNANWMEKQLVRLGVEIRRQVTVRDEVKEIGKGLEFLCEVCDVVITSGGLGPTHDDMTLYAIAVAFDQELAIDKEALEIVMRQYKILFKEKIVATEEMTESRLKMATIPVGGKALDNTVGGAPGVLLTYRGSTIFCLPGVPAELKDIWENSVKPWIAENVKGAYYEEIVDFEVVDESVFAPHIHSAIMKNPRVWIKSMPKKYGTTRVMRVWISSRGKHESEVKQNVKVALTSLIRESGLSTIGDE